MPDKGGTLFHGKHNGFYNWKSQVPMLKIAISSVDTIPSPRFRAVLRAI